jgi:hypothetical protein
MSARVQRSRPHRHCGCRFLLAFADANANAANTVQARWTPVQVSPTHPYFMGRGDCELVNELKDLISKNFSLRDLNYSTDCVPHQVVLDSFSVKAQALKPLPAAVAAARG